MPIVVNVHEAKTHLSRLLEQAHAGRLGIAFFEPLPDEELRGWEQ